MADIELVDYPQEPSSLPLREPPPVEKPDISLHKAAQQGRDDVVLQWMEVDKSKVDIIDRFLFTAFHYAAKHHHLNIMKLLVEFGADPTRYCEDSQTALHLAANCSRNPGEQDSQAIKESMKFLVEDLKLDANHLDVAKQNALHIACCKGNKAAVEVLLDQENIQLDQRADFGSILHMSCRSDNVEILELVLEKLKEKDKLSNVLTITDNGERTAVHFALDLKHLQKASKLLEFAQNHEITEIDPDLVLNCSQGKETDEILKFFESHDLKVLSRRRDGANILHIVYLKGWVRSTRVIIVNEPTLLNEKDNSGCTPLHYAAAKNDWEMIEVSLYQECVDVDIPDNEGCTPLLVAAREGNTETFTRLLDKADFNKKDNHGNNAACLATRADHCTILEVCKEKCPSILSVRRCGYGALHIAAEHGSEKSLKIFLDQHVDINIFDNEECTPLHYATEHGHNGVVEMLLAYDPPSVNEANERLSVVDLSAGNRVSDTPLHLAAWKGHCKVAATLLSKGASATACNIFSWTPLEYAAVYGHQKVVELLIPEYEGDEGYWIALACAAHNGHVDLVVALLNYKKDFTVTDKQQDNPLYDAIKAGEDDVVMAMVRHESYFWRQAMRTHQLDEDKEQQTTPMRELIKYMPEVALEILNKCTDVDNDSRDTKHRVKFDCEFFEDLGKPDSAGSKVPEEDAESISDSQTCNRKCSRRYFQPSYLLNRLIPRLLKSKRRDLYTEWGPTVFDIATHPLQLMVDHKRTELLDHPLVSTLIAFKWKMAWPLYLANIIFYLVFLGFLTAYALLVPNPQTEFCLTISNQSSSNSECWNDSNTTLPQCEKCSANQPFLYAAGAIVLLCVLVRVIMEFFQFLEQPGRYFLSHENWLELFLYCFTVIFMSSLGSVCVCPKPWQWQIGALAVFLAWIHLSIFVRKLPQLGLYIIMFEGIVLTFIKIAIPALLLVLAFSIALYMMFFVPSPLFAASPFATPGLSIIKTMTMAVGEMDFESIFRLTSGGVGVIDKVPTPIAYTGVSILLWIFFLVLMPILLMNLLTGLAVGDVEKIQSNAEYKKLALQIELVLKIEESFQAFRTWFIPRKRKIRVKPNKHRRRKKFLSVLSGLDTKNLTGEHISQSLSKPSKLIGINDVHKQTTAILAKINQQGSQRGVPNEVNTQENTEMAELKRAVTEIGELKTLVSDLKTAILEQRTEVGDIKSAMAEKEAEVTQQKMEMADLKTTNAEQSAEIRIVSQRMEQLLELLAKREGI